MTDAEKALLDAVLSGDSGERHSQLVERLIAAVNTERIRPEVKERYKSLYRERLLYTAVYRREIRGLGVPDGFDIGEWSREVQAELENEGVDLS